MEKNIKLHVEDLTVSFRTTQGMVRAVRGVTFDLHEGETLAVVGESGSGKSVSSRAIMGILAGNGIIDKGEIIYEDQDLTKISEDHYHDLRGNKIGMIFQDPMSSLNPIMRIGKQITEGMILNGKRLHNSYKKRFHLEKMEYRNAKAELKELHGRIKKIKKATRKGELTTSVMKKSTFKEDYSKLKIAAKLYRKQSDRVNADERERKIIENKEGLIAFKNDFLASREIFNKEAAEQLAEAQSAVMPLIAPAKARIKKGKPIYVKAKKTAKVETKLEWKEQKAKAAKLLEEAKGSFDKSKADKVKADYTAKVSEAKAELKSFKSTAKELPRDEVKLGIASRKADLKALVAEMKEKVNAHQNDVAKIKEDLRRYKKVTKKEAYERAIEVMTEVGIPEPVRRFKQYPFQFSGGMRQRIVIAIALTASPDVLICDEPTTALDVTIQAQILELINDLKSQRNLSVIFITHDLGVVANMADRIAVMYAGKVVEIGTAEDVFYDPRHPYTWALLSSMPDLTSKERLSAIPGTPPNMLFPPVGDAFAERNSFAMQIDFEKQPPMFEISDTHYAATWLLHKDAPKIDIPEVIKNRIARMTNIADEVKI